MSLLSANWIRGATQSGGVRVINNKGTVVEESLIEPIEEDRLKYIEGSSYDFTIDSLQSPDLLGDSHPDNASTFIGVDMRITPGMEDAVLSTCFVTKFVKNGKNIGRIRMRPMSDNEAKAMAFRMGAEFISTSEVHNVWILDPGMFFLAGTLQKVNIPLDVAMLINPRTTMFRGGLAVHCTWAHPNYQGQLFVGINNLRISRPAFIQKGARFITAHFFEFDRSLNLQDNPQIIVKYTDPYDCSPHCVSAWQGGRDTSNGEIIGAH
jgi:deoxycytidine triphosphate deaminase